MAIALVELSRRQILNVCVKSFVNKQALALATAGFILNTDLKRVEILALNLIFLKKFFIIILEN